jgi:fermentation-respiration switch protein FrsA (DUF1100 family)
MTSGSSPKNWMELSRRTRPPLDLLRAADVAEPIAVFVALHLANERGYQPAAVAKTLTMRLLVLQGARDYQVTTADFALWQETLSSRPNAKLMLYPDLNHLFMTGKGKSTPAEYEQPGHVAE